MKQYVGLVALAVAVVAGPVVLLRAGVDGDGDGCVDLRDYALMQTGFTGPGCAPREIVSFFAEGAEEFILVPVVPGVNGIVVTDLICQRTVAVNVTLVQESGREEATKLKATFGASSTTNAGDQRSYHLNTGIPFAAGSTIKALASGTGVTPLTVVGYTY